MCNLSRNNIILQKCETTFKFQNGVLCRILFMCTRYFRLTNYLWMACEGYYLHKLVAVAFAQQPSLKSLYVVGWGEKKQALSI